MTAELLALALFAADLPVFAPPPGGMGAESMPLSVRALGMGGASTAVFETESVVMNNPSAGAWAGRAGVTWAFGCRSGDDPSRDGECSFPAVSAVVPTPFRVVLNIGLAERSRLREEGTLSLDGWRGIYHWRGSLSEAYVGLSVKANEWLSFSAGSRGSFGGIRSEASVSGAPSGPEVPTGTEYVDDARFRPCWGAQFGAFVHTRRLDLGASVVTDRSGRLSIDRDLSGTGESSSSTGYDIPGEVNLGLTLKPADWLLLSSEVHGRKSLSIPGASVERGRIYSFGTEALLGGGFAVRAGWSGMEGLWRDGSERLSAGCGYRFARGRASLDFAAVRETWDGGAENGFFVSLWASESW